MTDDRRQADELSRAGEFDRQLEENIDLRPDDAAAIKLAKEVVGIGIALSIQMFAPGIAAIVKSVVALGGFLWQPRKSERTKTFLLGLAERLERTRSEYVRWDEFPDLLEDTLRRTAEQPDGQRRETMRRIFLKIMESPLSHVENRLLIRLADELPPDALKALAVLQTPLTKQEIELRTGHSILAARMGVSSEREIYSLMTYLANENLFDEHSFSFTAGFGAAGNDLKFLLTSVGRDLVEYGKG